MLGHEALFPPTQPPFLILLSTPHCLSQSPVTPNLFWDLHINSSLRPFATHSSTPPLPQHGVPLPILLILHVLRTAWYLSVHESRFTEWLKETFPVVVRPCGLGTVPAQAGRAQDPLLGVTVDFPPQLELCESRDHVSLFSVSAPVPLIVHSFPHLNL